MAEESGFLSDNDQDNDESSESSEENSPIRKIGRIVVQSNFISKVISLTNNIIYVRPMNKWLLIDSDSLCYEHFKNYGMYLADVWRNKGNFSLTEILKIKENFYSELHVDNFSCYYRFLNTTYDLPEKDIIGIPVQDQDIPERKIIPEEVGKFTTHFDNINGYRYVFTNIVYVIDNNLQLSLEFVLLNYRDAEVGLALLDREILSHSLQIIESRFPMQTISLGK